MSGKTQIWNRSLATSAVLIVALAILAALVLTYRSQAPTRAAFEPAPMLLGPERFPNRPLRRPVGAATYDRLIPPPQHWYTENLERTGCIESDGPLPMLETLRASGPLVSVHRNDRNTLERVKVEVAEDALRARRIEFYPSRLACEDAAASNRRMRDPYRG